MEKELLNTLLNYGVLGILGYIFLKYIINILNDNLEQNKKNFEKIVESLVLIEDRLIHGHFEDETILIIAVGRWRVWISEFKSKINMILINNNIKANIKAIKNELETHGKDSINSLNELLKFKTSNENRLTIIEFFKQNIDNTINEILSSLENINIDKNSDKCFVYSDTIRDIDSRLDIIKYDIINEINNLDI